MSDDGFIASVTAALSSALAPLADTDQLDAVLARLGWPPPSGTGVAEQFADASAAVGRLASDVAAGADAGTLVAGVIEAITALGGLGGAAVGASAGAPYDDPAFWAALPAELLALLVSETLELNAPGLYGVLSFIGVFGTTAVAADPASGRAAYTARTMDWAALVRSITSPHTLMRDTYGWGDDFDHGRLLNAVGALAAGVGAAAALVPLQRSFAEPFVAPDNPDRRTMKQLVVFPFVLPGATLAAVAEPSLVVSPLPPAGEPSSRPEGLLLSPTLTGAAQATIDLRGGAVLTITGDVAATPHRIGLRPSGATREVAAVDADLEARVDIAPPAPVLLGGTPEGTRFELAAAHLVLAVSGNDADLAVEIEVGLDDAVAVVDFSQADSFVGSLVGGGRYELPLAVEIGWSSASGLYISGGAELSFTVPVDLVIGGLLTITEIHVSLGPSADAGTARLEVSATGSMALGPFVVTFHRLGIAVDTAAASFDAPGNFGLLDVAFGFKPPDGIGLALDAGIVGGGGYLAIDTSAGTYEGVIDLQIAAVGISAVVIVDTRAPGVSGWSVFFALFLDLPSIQLGFGFTLEGVGGIAGINRTVDPDALIAAVRAGSLDTVLFPTDPIAQAPEIIDTFSAIFPPADGRYVFGPVVQIGWGTPALVTVELGIVVELPDPILIAVLGSLTSVLPTEDLDLVDLHVDFAGIVDFEAGTVSIDASLHDSSIVGFTLRGDMALRAVFAGQPTFVVALGGFHPGFDAPCGFPELERLSLGIGVADVIDISFGTYLAATSNTVQFGAEIEVEAKVEGFGVEGGMSFDTLIQFQPFWFTTSMDMHVAVTAGDFELLAVRLYGSLEGPNPWRVVGTAEFEFLGFAQRVQVDERIGDGRPDRSVEAPDVLDELCRIVEGTDAWAGGAAGATGVTLGAPPTSELVLTPDQTVVVTQRLVPLDTVIERFGESTGLDHERFRLVVAGSGAGEAAVVEDWFAPGQLWSLAPQEQLVTPSFEQYPAGLEFGGGVTGGPAKPVELGHEQILRDPDLPPLPEELATSIVMMSAHPAASIIGAATAATWSASEVSFATVAG